MRQRRTQQPLMQRRFPPALALGFLVFAWALAGGALAQQEAPQEAPRTASFYLAPVEDSGITGHLQVTEEVEGGSKLVVTLQGITPGERYALALFEGDCGPDRPLVTELEPVSNLEGDPYVSLNSSKVPFAEFAEGDYFLYVYGGESTDAPVVACGEVGQGANASGFGEGSSAAAQPATTEAPGESANAGPAAQPEAPATPAGGEFTSPRAASYALSAVEGSGISGNLQVSEQIEGGTRLTVSLRGSDPAARYGVTLYQGDCGPDRPEVLQLTSVDASDGDPYSSITDSEFAFDAITQQDLFAYVFGPGGEVVACGEVGLGANP